MQWSPPKTYNVTRNLAHQMQAPHPTPVKALNTLIWYLISTPNCGLILEPDAMWNCEDDFEFVIHGCSDSDYAMNTHDHHSVSGGHVFLNGAPIIF